MLIGDVKFLWKTIWRANVPGKVKICVWRCCLNVLTTRDNLRKKKMALAPTCLFYDADIETINHLLRDCPQAVAWVYVANGVVDNH